MANKGDGDAGLPDPSTENNKETFQEQSSHRNDPESNPNLDATVESVDSSGPKIELDEESNPDPDTTSENSSEPVEKPKVSMSVTCSGFSQISQPENVQKSEKDTINEPSSQMNDPTSNLGPDKTVEIKNSSELQKKLDDMTTSGKPQESQSNIVAENEKDTIKEPSSQTNDPTSNLGSDKTVENKNSSELQRKIEDMTTSGKPQESQSNIVAENEQDTIKDPSSQTNDPTSNLGPDKTVEIKNSSELQKKLDDMTTSEKPQESQSDIVAENEKDTINEPSSQTNDPKSNIGPDKTVENKNSSELQRKIEDMTTSGKPQESQSNIVAENEKDTIKDPSSQTNDPTSNLGPDKTVEIKNSSELQKKLDDMTTSEKPQESQSDIVAENEKDTINEPSSQTNDPKSNIGPDKTVENKNCSELQRKIEDMTTSGKPQESQSNIVAENEQDTIKDPSSQTNDPTSNLGPDKTVEIKNSSELQKKLDDMTTSEKPQESQSDIVAENEKDTINEPSSQTNDPTSNIGPDKTVENKNSSELQRKIEDMTTSGKPQESQSNIVAENEKDTIKDPSSQTNDPTSNLGPDKTVEIKNSSELQKKLDDMTTSEKPQESQSDIVAENEQDTIKEPSSQTNDPTSNLGPDKTVEIKNSSELQKKLDVSMSVSVSVSVTCSGFPQISQPENVQKSEKPDTLKSENSTSSEPKEKQKGSVQESTSSGPPQISQPEREDNEKFPLNIQKPKEVKEVKEIEEDETARHINEENVERDENEVQDQDQNLQSQITNHKDNGINKTFCIGAIVFLLVAVCAFMPSPDSTPPKPNQLNVVEVFNQEMEKLETNFPNQRPELWRRSLIHLRRHLKTENPSEPVSLILTSGHRAEKTLDCLARCLAQAFSTAVNSSVLNINGKSKASQDSDQVKLDIDRELRNAFDSKKSAAVIHRFEELPPGSTLIFYRYCDHENAAYKNIFLAFTVMLDAEVEVPSNVSLGRVEEMVQEHIKQKFVSDDKSAMFNKMDVDKLSGLWSRISHLILPVAAEDNIEQQGCGDCGKSF